MQRVNSKEFKYSISKDGFTIHGSKTLRTSSDGLTREAFYSHAKHCITDHSDFYVLGEFQGKTENGWRPIALLIIELQEYPNQAN